MKRETASKYPLPEFGLELEIIGCPVWKCACGVVVPEIPNPEALRDNLIKALIVLPEPLDGDEILFLRKRMGLTGAKLAEVLGVSRVEVSRWENDAVDISPHMDFKIRAETIDRLVPEEYRNRAKLALANVMHRVYKTVSVNAPIQVPAVASAGAFAFA
jgi:DNA-binding XRE family transcriptional regulator